jgi:hypothetical protein
MIPERQVVGVAGSQVLPDGQHECRQDAIMLFDWHLAGLPCHLLELIQGSHDRLGCDQTQRVASPSEPGCASASVSAATIPEIEANNSL